MNNKIINTFLSSFESEMTQENYRMDLEDYTRYCVDVDAKVLDATSLQIRDYANTLKKRGLADSTRARRMSAIRSFYKFLYETEVREDSVYSFIKIPKVDSGRHGEFLTLDEIDLFMKNIEGRFKVRDKTIVILMIMTGVRVSELINLNHEDVRGDVLVVKSGKGNKTRILSLNKTAREALDEYYTTLNTIKPEDPLFKSQQDKRISTDSVRKMVKRTAERAGIKKNISPHSLRHTHAMLLLDNDVNIKVIQEMLGHSTLAVTERYLHIHSSDIKDAAAVLQF